MRSRMQRIAYATVVLVVALAGAAWAAGTITGKQIKDGSISGKDVKNHSITKQDLSGNFRGPQGPQGPQGIQGPQGLQGPAGSSALSQLTEVSGTMTIAAGDVDGGTLDCPAGQKAVSGGYEFIAADGEIFVDERALDGTGWTILADNFDSSVEGELTALAYCAGAGQAVAARVSRPIRRTDATRALARHAERILTR